ncbi:hypothetical protein FE257_004093 [Aspergillus nanangensis]|uniref:Uncharacterized protein n=1 Tax=Aspergillus nanangensis TaxID=2582783 RepID=A0AAD4CAY4_ASPNN|nr:hypothetical protein FE257_004093 [Aspergillus nanangensis]
MNRRTDRWGATLTMYGHTIHTPTDYESQIAAKVEACFGALKRLKPTYHNWTVPRDPNDGLTDANWDWIGLLYGKSEVSQQSTIADCQDNCVHNGLPAPVYTRCVHKDGDICYEVELLGATYSGPIMQYKTNLEAQNTAAHQTSYHLLVFGNGDDCDTPGPFTLRNAYENRLAEVPRVLSRDSQTRAVKKRTDISEMDFQSGREIKRRKTTTTGEKPVGQAITNKKQQAKNPKNQIAPKNSNLLPVSNCRITPVEVPLLEEPTRWGITPQKIMKELDHVPNPTERLKRVCELISLEHPEIKVDRVDRRLIESEGAYNVAAYFHSDPFLARVGGIGRFQNINGTKEVVINRCASEVVKYLLDVVKEDTKLETENRKKRMQCSQWWDTARKSSGYK